MQIVLPRHYIPKISTVYQVIMRAPRLSYHYVSIFIYSVKKQTANPKLKNIEHLHSEYIPLPQQKLVIAHETPSHDSDHVCQIWRESIQSSRYY